MGIATFDVRRKDIEDHPDALRDLYSRCAIIFEVYEFPPDYDFRYRVCCDELDQGAHYNALVRGANWRECRFEFVEKPALRVVRNGG